MTVSASAGQTPPDRRLPLGWKQRDLACAILHGPSIPLLDDPTGGVTRSTQGVLGISSTTFP